MKIDYEAREKFKKEHEDVLKSDKVMLGSLKLLQDISSKNEIIEVLGLAEERYEDLMTKLPKFIEKKKQKKENKERFVTNSKRCEWL